MKKLIGFALFALLSSGAGAQSYYNGTVYGVYPDGVLVQRGGSSYLVPHQQASFRIGDVNIAWSDLRPGQDIYYYAPQNNVRYVQDPYAWQQRYRPRHPHGAPPGQVKKWRKHRGHRW